MNHLDTLLHEKIAFEDYKRLIMQNSSRFSAAEMALLNKILRDFAFDAAQAQALANAVLQQSRFDPNAAHIFDDDEDFTGVCSHCLNPPIPPLRDYQMWREQNT